MGRGASCRADTAAPDNGRFTGRCAASAGYAVLRFDFMGHGDSDGESEDCTIGSYITDLDAAIAHLKAECPELENIARVGLRFGATVASIYANRHPEVSSTVLWEPVIDGHKICTGLAADKSHDPTSGIWAKYATTEQCSCGYEITTPWLAANFGAHA